MTRFKLFHMPLCFALIFAIITTGSGLFRCTDSRISNDELVVYAIDSLNPDLKLRFGSKHGDTSVEVHSGATLSIPIYGLLDPENEFESIKYSIDDESVAEIVHVFYDYISVRGLKEGRTKLKAQMLDDELAEVEIIVLNNDEQPVPPSKSVDSHLTFELGGSSTIDLNADLTLGVLIYGLKQDDKIEFSLGDGTLANVIGTDGTYLYLRGMKGGSTKLAAKTSDGGITEVAVNVKQIEVTEYVQPHGLCLGDVNADQVLDILDVICLNKHVLGISELRSDCVILANLDGDKTVTANDALLLLKLVIGNEVTIYT